MVLGDKINYKVLWFEPALCVSVCVCKLSLLLVTTGTQMRKPGFAALSALPGSESQQITESEFRRRAF